MNVLIVRFVIDYSVVMVEDSVKHRGFYLKLNDDFEK